MFFSTHKNLAIMVALGVGLGAFGADTVTLQKAILDKPKDLMTDASTIEEAFKKGKFSGYLRLHHIVSGDPVAKNGSAIGGKLKYETVPLLGFNAGVAFYTAHDTGFTEADEGPAQGLLGDNLEAYDTLGEAYINYKNKNIAVRIGRQEFKTPLTENAVTIIPNLFEGAVVSVNSISNLSIGISHITKMQYGTRSATDKLLIDDVAYAMTAGTGEGLESAAGDYGATTTKGKNRFMSIAEAALGKTAENTNGMTILNTSYLPAKNIKINFWDYYTWDIMNTIYIDGEYKAKIGDVGLKLDAQYLNQKDVGDYARSTSIRGRISHYNKSTDKFIAQNLWTQIIDASGNIDATMYGARAAVTHSGLTIIYAFNKTSNGHVINPFGGDPAYTSMIFGRNGYRADTDSYKIGTKFEFEQIGIKGLVFNMSHAEFDTMAVYYTTATGNTTVTKDETTKINDFMVTYTPPTMKALTIRAFYEQRDNDTRKYDQDHTRVIVNYNF